MDEKEKDFVKEYKELLQTHNVSLCVKTWSDEYGNHTDITFKENGKYCNINYCPDTMRQNKGRCGMGG